MKITVQVKPSAKQNKVEQTGPAEYRVWVKAPAMEGRATEAAGKLLGDYLGIPKSFVRLVSGNRSRIKRFEIPSKSSA